VPKTLRLKAGTAGSLKVIYIMVLALMNAWNLETLALIVGARLDVLE
jgi:hypothetical protein